MPTLIYPYYTVQSNGGNAFNTYVSVVNTTDVVKVVKVRFREGKNSREVLDFNLYLSPNDVWTGAVIPSGTGASDPGRLITADTSCTNPAIPADGRRTSVTSPTPAPTMTTSAPAWSAPAKAISR